MEETNKSNILQMIGKNIKQLRLLRGFSQENLASDLQKSVNFVSLLENGKTGLSVQTIVDICMALNVDANAIFDGVIPLAHIQEDAFVTQSLNLFDKKDKAIVYDLITYIINSKN